MELVHALSSMRSIIDNCSPDVRKYSNTHPSPIFQTNTSGVRGYCRKDLQSTIPFSIFNGNITTNKEEEDAPTRNPSSSSLRCLAISCATFACTRKKSPTRRKTRTTIMSFLSLLFEMIFRRGIHRSIKNAATRVNTTKRRCPRMCF